MAYPGKACLPSLGVEKAARPLHYDLLLRDDYSFSYNKLNLEPTDTHRDGHHTGYMSEYLPTVFSSEKLKKYDWISLVDVRRRTQTSKH